MASQALGVSGRCTPLLAYQRGFDALRRPLTSFVRPDPTSPRLLLRRHRRNVESSVDQVFVLRKLDSAAPSFRSFHSRLFFRSDSNSRIGSMRFLIDPLSRFVLSLDIVDSLLDKAKLIFICVFFSLFVDRIDGCKILFPVVIDFNVGFFFL